MLPTLVQEPRLRDQQPSELSTEVESLADSDWTPTRRGRRRGRRGHRYEYRSKRTVWGIPLVHVAFGGDPSGRPMALARGVIAIGEAAVGLVAIGGFAGGGVTIAGMSLGVISLSGLSVGLFLAMGGIAFGGFAVGSLAFGAVGAVGVLPLTMLDPSAETMQWLSLAAWGTEHSRRYSGRSGSGDLAGGRRRAQRGGVSRV